MGEVLSSMHGTHQYDICCLNLCFLNNMGILCLFYFSYCLNLEEWPVSKELDLIKMIERKGGTEVQTLFDNVNAHLQTT